jgi:hypothetical protein
VVCDYHRTWRAEYPIGSAALAAGAALVEDSAQQYAEAVPQDLNAEIEPGPTVSGSVKG